MAGNLDEKAELYLWDAARRSVPPRPARPESYPETDARRWWDYEYAGWSGAKLESPASSGDGPAGKRVLAFIGGEHPYFREYEAGMRAEAARRGIRLEIRRADWDAELQSRQVREAAQAAQPERPDLAIVVPVDSFCSAEVLRRLHEAGIPTIASNIALEPGAYPYVRCWTGPDDWGQYRLLARRFAEELGGRGGYCVVTHRPGLPPYYARFWGLVTELAACAPEMVCLDARFTGFDREETRRTAREWIERFGGSLKGIVCADDGAPQDGVNLAAAELGRGDLVLVANGATRRGLESLREGKLRVLTYQPPELDGALPVVAAADWFDGLELEPVRYLPRRLLDREGARALLASAESPGLPEPGELAAAIAERRLADVDAIFARIESALGRGLVVDADELRGLGIELVSEILEAGRAGGADAAAVVGGRRMLAKGVFSHATVSSTLGWLRQAARAVLAALLEGSSPSGRLADRMLAYVEIHYAEPLSLKTLGERLGLTPAYLGKVFKEATGASFSRHLNERRIAAARELVASGRASAKEAALSVGYADPDYFSEVFRAIVGVGPAEYARNSAIASNMARTFSTGVSGRT